MARNQIAILDDLDLVRDVSTALDDDLWNELARRALIHFMHFT